jgi:hypothetical protein
MQFMPMHREKARMMAVKSANRERMSEKQLPLSNTKQQQVVHAKRNQDIREVMKSPKIEFMVLRAMSAQR